MAMSMALARYMVPSTHSVVRRAILLLDKKHCCVPKTEIGMLVFQSVSKVDVFYENRGRVRPIENSSSQNTIPENSCSLKLIPL